MQRRIIFNVSGHPGAPTDYNLNSVEEIRILTEDNINLLSWFHKGEENASNINLFHGNLFNIGDRAYRMKRYIDKNWSIILVSGEGLEVIKVNLLSQIYIKMVKLS